MDSTEKPTFQGELIAVIRTLRKAVRDALPSNQTYSQEEEIDLVIEKIRQQQDFDFFDDLEIVKHLKTAVTPNNEELESIGSVLRETDWSTPGSVELFDSLKYHPSQAEVVNSIVQPLHLDLTSLSLGSPTAYPSKKSRMDSDKGEGGGGKSGFDFVFDLNSLDDFPAYEPLQDILTLFEQDPTSKTALTKLMTYDLNDLYEHCQWEELRAALFRALELSLGRDGSSSSRSAIPDAETQLLALQVHERLMRGLNGYQLPDCVSNVIRYLLLAWHVAPRQESTDSFLNISIAPPVSPEHFSKSLLEQQQICCVCAWETLAKLETQCTPENMCKIIAGLMLLLSRGGVEYMPSVTIPILQLFSGSTNSKIRDSLVVALSSFFRLSKAAVNNVTVATQLGFVKQLLVAIDASYELYSPKNYDTFAFQYRAYSEAILFSILAPFAAQSGLLESICSSHVSTVKWSGACDGTKGGVYEDLPEVTKVDGGNKLFYVLHGCDPLVTVSALGVADNQLTNPVFDIFLNRATASCLAMVEIEDQRCEGDYQIDSYCEELFVTALVHARSGSSTASDKIISDSIRFGKYQHDDSYLEVIVSAYVEAVSASGDGALNQRQCSLWAELVDAVFAGIASPYSKPLLSLMLSAVPLLVSTLHRVSFEEDNQADIIVSLARLILYSIDAVTRVVGQRPVEAVQAGAYRRLSRALRTLPPVFVSALVRMMDTLSQTPSEQLEAISNKVKELRRNASVALQEEKTTVEGEEDSVFADYTALAAFFLCEQSLFVGSQPSEEPCVEDDLCHPESCINSLLRFTAVHTNLHLLSGHAKDMLFRLIAVALHREASCAPLLNVLLGWVMAGRAELALRVMYAAWIYPSLCSVSRRSALTSEIYSVDTVTVDWILSRTFSAVLTDEYDEFTDLRGQSWWTHYLDILFAAMGDISFRLLASKHLMSLSSESISTTCGTEGWDQEALFAHSLLRLRGSISNFHECGVPSSINPRDEAQLDRAIALLSTEPSAVRRGRASGEFGTIAASECGTIEQLESLGDRLSTSEAIGHLRVMLAQCTYIQKKVYCTDSVSVMSGNAETKVDPGVVEAIVKAVNEEYLFGIAQSPDTIKKQVTWMCGIADSVEDWLLSTGCVWFLAVVSLLVSEDVLCNTADSALLMHIHSICESLFGRSAQDKYLSHVYSCDAMTRSVVVLYENGCRIELVVTALRQHWTHGYLPLKDILFLAYKTLVSDNILHPFDSIIGQLTDNIQLKSDNFTLYPMGTIGVFEVCQDK